MMKHGDSLWHRHPGVRSGKQLTFGERAADKLKKGFGTWTALGTVAFSILVWMLVQRFMGRSSFDPYPYILLNLCLSCLAAVQGIILQISANRGDRISAEVSDHTRVNTDRLITMNLEILQILGEVKHLNEEMDQAREREGAEMGTIQLALSSLAGRIDKLSKPDSVDYAVNGGKKKDDYPVSRGTATE